MKLLNFENWSSGKLSKIGHHFRKQSDLKIDVIKKCQLKKCASNFVFFHEKKSKDLDDFGHRKLTFNTSPLQQFAKFNDFI
jgi:hypothetical protein